MDYKQRTHILFSVTGEEESQATDIPIVLEGVEVYPGQEKHPPVEGFLDALGELITAGAPCTVTVRILEQKEWEEYEASEVTRLRGLLYRIYDATGGWVSLANRLSRLGENLCVMASDTLGVKERIPYKEVQTESFWSTSRKQLTCKVNDFLRGIPSDDVINVQFMHEPPYVMEEVNNAAEEAFSAFVVYRAVPETVEKSEQKEGSEEGSEE